MRRVSVVGNSGSGKSTLAQELARVLGARYLELDSIFHLPGWNELPPDEFRRQVGEAMVDAAWVIDGNYSVVRDLVWSRADTVVWVDPPRFIVMARIVRRTLWRVLTRTELWNGNREPWSNLFSWDAQRSVIAWAWTQHGKYREVYGTSTRDATWDHLAFIRVRRRADRRRVLRLAASVQCQLPDPSY